MYMHTTFWRIPTLWYFWHLFLFLINVCLYFRVFIQVWITSWERNFILYFLEFRWDFFMLVFDLKSGLFKFCVVVWFVDQWYFSVPYMYFCQGDSHWIPFFYYKQQKVLFQIKLSVGPCVKESIIVCLKVR